jgi:flagellar biosynthesis/type III secretory pathway protein FliH
MATLTRPEAPALGRRIEAEVWDAGRRARAAVRAAEEEAARILAAAALERERVRRDAAEAGRAEGLARAAAALASAQAARDALLAGAAAELGGLAVSIARRILGRELALSPEAVAAVAARAVREVRARRDVTVRVSPSDEEAVRRAEPGLAALLERGALSVRADPALQPGDVVVESEAGRVDARVETQLAAFARALGESSP